MKQLRDIGVSAIRACTSAVSDVSKGKYQFGMIFKLVIIDIITFLIMHDIIFFVARVSSVSCLEGYSFQ